MGQPNPPGNLPLFEGLGEEWNDIVGAIPEDRRAELAPRIKQRLEAQVAPYKPLEPWQDFQKSGITPEHTRAALDVFNYLENNPKQVYDELGKHLGLTPAQAKQATDVLEKIQEGDPEDPRIATMQKQIDTLSQIALFQKNQEAQQQMNSNAEAEINKELEAVKAKYGSDVNEEEIIMRMLHKDMSAEDAHKEFSGMVEGLRKTRPAPMLLGASGAIPSRTIDPTKLDSKDTKALVAQMMQASLDRNKQ